MDCSSLAALFHDPPAAYRPMVFWLWNGEITPEGISEQIADFAAQGCGGFFLHPMGEDFRLGDFIQGMSPPYLSAEFFALVRLAAECARDHGLYCWLYDEGGWPSGNAQGQVVDGWPEHQRKLLVARRVRALTAAEAPPRTVAVLGLPELGIPEPVDLKALSQALTPYTDFIVFTLEADPGFINVLCPAAVRRFIQVTHERYAEAVGDLFGAVIPGIFTDETPLGGQLGGAAVPWTQELLELLTGQMGRDARVYLPLLFGAEAVGEDVLGRYAEHERVAARCEYYECVTRLFQAAYWEQITEWCRAHNLIHTGHVGGEDNLPDHRHFGHFFRTAGTLDAPGVDVIWRQLDRGADNFPFPRLASSALKRHPRRPEGPLANLALTESNAVYGYGLEYEQMRWLADYQFQAGLNLYAPMASCYTTAGGRLYGTMSHFGPGMPLWAGYGAFAEYIGRQCALARHTVEPAAIAVYYPIETVWANDDSAAAAWESLQSLCGLLQESQRAFDFVDAENLGEGTLVDGTLALAQADYRVILVPRALTMPAATLGRLAELAEAGLTVVFLDCLPMLACDLAGATAFALAAERLAATAEVLDLSELAERVEELLPTVGPMRLTEAHPELLVSARRTADQAWVYLVTNNGAEVVRPVFSVGTEGPGALETWNLRDGEVTALLATGEEPQDLVPVLSPWSSQVFVARPGAPEALAGSAIIAEDSLAYWLATPAAERPGRAPQADVVAEFFQADRVRVVEQSLVEDGGLRVLAGPETAELLADSPVHLGLWDEWAALRDFAGRVEYAFDLPLADEFVGRELLLDLGEVFWAATVAINGVKVADSLWPPHVLDIGQHVRGGDNTLTVTVANTLANAIQAESVVAEAESRGWLNPYWRRAAPMMADRRAGLIGPLRVLLPRPEAE